MAHSFRSRPYDLAVDTINEGDLQELIAWLKDFPRLTMGETTQEFETIWSDWLGVKYSVLCNSGSSANLLMFAALDSNGRSGNRKVVVPAAGWVTTIAPAIQFGWEPIMCEVNAETYSFDTNVLKDILEKDKPDTVILVHLLGVPANMQPLLELQKTYGFNLIEDCCASHGATHRGQKVGTFGAMSSFSFYYGHHMSTIEGGIVSTDDEDLYHQLLMLRSHGWLKDLPQDKADGIRDRHNLSSFGDPFTFAVPGFNLRSNDLCAQLGIIQMGRLDDTIATRAGNHKVYQEKLDGRFEYASFSDEDEASSISFLAVASDESQRRVVVETLNHHEIDTRLFTAGNLGRHPFWSDRYGTFSAPVADRLYHSGFFLPNNQALSGDDIKHICTIAVEAAGLT